MPFSFPITIYHNPACGTSRNVLAMIRAAGYEPTVVEYLKVGWDIATLMQLHTAIGGNIRDMLRTKGIPEDTAALVAACEADTAILEAMVQYPILVNRPIVVTSKGAKLCRPSEVVFSLLENLPTTFTKEDGDKVIPTRNQ